MNMTIAVDFDGTIVEHKYPEIGKINLFAFETLKELQKQGHDLILWTSRYGKELDDAVNFCKSHGIEFYAINSNFPGDKFIEGASSRKIVADLYIDDRIPGGFPGWSKTWELITASDLAVSEKNAVRDLNRKKFSLFGKKKK
jgi:hypothetical protein